MTSRWNNRTHTDSVEELASRVPDRLLNVGDYLETDHGDVTGLRRYMRDMNEWLRGEMQLPPIALAGKASAEPPVHAVMEAIGCPASEWYRILLTRG